MGVTFMTFLRDPSHEKMCENILQTNPEIKSITIPGIETYSADCRKIAAVDSNKHDCD